jgi:phosphoglycerate kinase
MRTIDSINFKGLRALIRVDFNVPLDEQFNISDSTRIDAALPSIRKILADGGSVVLMSHLGRPKEGPTPKYSLSHLLPYLNKVLGQEVKFADDCIGSGAFELSADLKPGEVLLLENLRFYKEEEKGNEEFAAKLARHGDVYVNDAFGTAHRAHASTAVIASFMERKVFGYLMAAEVANIEKVLSSAERPSLAILGGAKVSTKIEIIKNLIGRVDHLIIGGGMMFTFIKARGGQTGSSLVEDDFLNLAGEIMRDAASKGTTLHIPVDTIAADAFDNNANRSLMPASAIPAGWMGLDIGPETEKQFSAVIAASRTILWNGPMGVFEMSNFESGTKVIAEAVALATANGSYSLIGGGDSVAAINKYGYQDKVSYVSTGGGAMLEAIEGKILPGVAAIR